jgi:hypothetical protein
MKQFLAGLGVGAVLVLFGALLLPQLSGRWGMAAQRTVTVSGTATVKAPADTALISFATATLVDRPPPVEADDGKADEAHNRIDEARKKSKAVEKTIREALLKLPSKAQIRTADWVGNVAVQDHETETAIVQSYWVEVQNEEATKLQEAARAVVEIAWKNDAVHDPEPRGDSAMWRLPRILFFKQKADDSQRLALDAAMSVALAKARALAGPGAKVEPIEVVEHTDDPKQLAFNGYVMVPGGSALIPQPRGGSPTQPGGQPAISSIEAVEEQRPGVAGEIEFTRRVTVKCAY